MDGLRLTSISVQDAQLQEQEDGTTELVQLKRAVCKGFGRHEQETFPFKLVVEFRAETITVSVDEAPIPASKVAETLYYHFGCVANEGSDLFHPIDKEGDETTFLCRTTDPDKTLGVLHRFRQSNFVEPKAKRVKTYGSVSGRGRSRRRGRR